MTVVGAGQRRVAGREDDVVAVAPEADEARARRRAFPGQRAARASRCRAASGRCWRRDRGAPSRVPACGEAIVTRRWQRALRAARRARREPPGRPCCARRSPARGRSPARVAHRRRDRLAVVVDRPEDGLEARPRRRECPRRRSRRSHGFHRPRLQKKPWTRRTPRRPRAVAGQVIGLALPSETAGATGRRAAPPMTSSGPGSDQLRRFAGAHRRLRHTTIAASRTRSPARRHSRRRPARRKPARATARPSARSRSRPQRSSAEQGRGDELLEARDHAIRRGNKKGLRLFDGGLQGINSLTMSYFHTGTRNIIGAEAFHCPVRDGKEWDHLAMVIRHNRRPRHSGR